MSLSRIQSTEKTNGATTAVRPLVAPEIRELEQRMQDASRWIAPLHREMGKVIVGQRGLVDRLLLGLLTNGHILLEGVPGLAKTLALKIGSFVSQGLKEEGHVVSWAKSGDEALARRISPSSRAKR